MSTNTTQQPLRPRLGRLTVVASACLILVTVGLGDLATADTVHTPTGQTFRFNQLFVGSERKAGTRSVNAGGSGFVPGATIRIVLRYAKTIKHVHNAASVTASSDGKFLVNIPVPVNQLTKGKCDRIDPHVVECEYRGTVYARAIQVSPGIVTPRATVHMFWAQEISV